MRCENNSAGNSFSSRRLNSRRKVGQSTPPRPLPTPGQGRRWERSQRVGQGRTGPGCGEEEWKGAEGPHVGEWGAGGQGTPRSAAATGTSEWAPARCWHLAGLSCARHRPCSRQPRRLPHFTDKSWGWGSIRATPGCSCTHVPELRTEALALPRAPRPSAQPAPGRCQPQRPPPSS